MFAILRRLRPRKRWWTSPVVTWLLAALVMAGAAIAIGEALESPILGWLAADGIFLLIMAVYAAVQGSAARAQH